MRDLLAPGLLAAVIALVSACGGPDHDARIADVADTWAGDPTEIVAPSTTADVRLDPGVKPAHLDTPAAVDKVATQRLIELIDGLRVAAGVGPAARDIDLEERAVARAADLARAGDDAVAQPVDALIEAGWTSAGQVAARGTDLESLFATLAAGEAEYADMVDPGFTAMGVGVVVDAEGMYWAVQLWVG